MADLTGTRLGPYRVESLIGTGGFASVFLARDDRLQDRVAIKILADNHALSPEIRERFIAEGHLLRRIDSPQVTQIFDIGETADGRPYLVLAYADRGDLRARVDQRRAAGWAPSTSDLRTVTHFLHRALAVLHHHRLVHRDLKPRNILIRSQLAEGGDAATEADPLVAGDERLMLSDFGMAKDLALHSGLTIGGGSPGFQSPEQVRPLTNVDQRSDLYAASATLVWLITGEAPDPTSDWAEEVGRRTGPGVAHVLAIGLDTDPDRRFDDVDRWHDAVINALNDPMQVPRSARTGTRRLGGWRAVAAGVAVAASLGVGAVVAWPGDGFTPITAQADGTIEAVDTVGDRTLTVTGPAALTVGETATYRVTPDQVDDWTWIAPDGERYTNTTDVELTPASAGITILEVRSTTADGEDETDEDAVTVRLRLVVEDA
ncbi:MAG: serine/threonine-protein kinase [Actinomycetota bacterium]